MLEIRLLGQFDLRQDGVTVELPSRPARTLLAYLVLTLGIRHPRERLAGLLWPDSSERNARKNLRQALWHLRKAIGEAHLLVDPTSIGFDKTSDFWLDIGLLENAAGQDLETEVSVYEGELLPGFYEDWVLLEHERLDAVYERKMQRLLAKLLQVGRWTEVLDWAERWIAQGQVPEAAYRALMMAHAALGEPSKVEAVYQRCAEALRQKVEVNPSEETQHLYKSLLAGEKISPYPYPEKPGGVASMAPQQINLPAQPMPFIGRREELAEIKRLLSTTRLLTLTGPGGMGKTRLAIKAAEEAADDFDDGVFFVPLAPISSVDHLIQTIAEAVNFPLPTYEDPKYQLLRYLQKKNLLLVMDNFEHLLDGVSIINEILKNTSNVKILATSQERLNLKGETNLHITGMNVDSELDEAKDDAIALFLQSAAKAQPGFKPTTDELTRITNICQFVGGMPLAIELAASWLYILSVYEINDELKKGLDILETEMRDAPERHRSIRAVYNRSWSLLDDNEREIFMRLSIFRGGFTRQAAQQVAGASLRQIAGLVNKSILRYDPHSGRLEIHELLRQYAQERLENTLQTSDWTKEAYAAYYADFMQEKWKQFRGSRQIPALTEIEADIENVRAAWRYYLDHKNALQLLKFIYGFWIVYYVRGWVRGAIELFADSVDALAQAEHDPDVRAVRAIAISFQGFFMSLAGLADEGYKLIRESIEILEGLDNPIELAFAYYNLTLTAYYLNRPAEEKDAALSFLKIVEASNDKWMLAIGLWFLGFAELSGKKYAEAKRLSEASLKLNNEIDNTFGSALCFVSLGGLAISTGDYAQAKKYFTRCLQTANKLNFNWLSSVAIKYLGEIALLTNNIPEAQEYLTQSLRIAYDLGSDRDIANHLYDFASLRVAQNKLEEGVELISLLLQQPASNLARAGGGLIRERAKTLLAELESRLSREGYEDALKRGELMKLGEVVVELVGPKINVG